MAWSTTRTATRCSVPSVITTRSSLKSVLRITTGSPRVSREDSTRNNVTLFRPCLRCLSLQILSATLGVVLSSLCLVSNSYVDRSLDFHQTRTSGNIFGVFGAIRRA